MIVRTGIVIVAATGCELFISIPHGKLATVDAAADADASADASALGCETDAACNGGACLPDGTCSDPARILYAAPAGTGVACTQAAPCTVQIALAHVTPAQDIVSLGANTYTLATSLAPTGTVIVTGYGATLQGNASPLVVPGNGADATFIGMHVIGDPGKVAFSCLSNTPVAMRLYKVTITGANAGVFASSCALSIDRSTIATMAGYGVYAQAHPLTLTRSFVVDNGSGANPFGGVYLQNVPSGSVRDTTIAGNNGGNGAAVRCAGSTSVAFASDIIYANTGGIEPVCTIAYSIVDASYTGATDITLDPSFIGGGDYHLAPDSPARGLGDPAAPATLDFDGEPRPQPSGTPPDPGADEIP